MQSKQLNLRIIHARVALVYLECVYRQESGRQFARLLGYAFSSQRSVSPPRWRQEAFALFVPAASVSVAERQQPVRLWCRNRLVRSVCQSGNRSQKLRRICFVRYHAVIPSPLGFPAAFLPKTFTRRRWLRCASSTPVMIVAAFGSSFDATWITYANIGIALGVFGDEHGTTMTSQNRDSSVSISLIEL